VLDVSGWATTGPTFDKESQKEDASLPTRFSGRRGGVSFRKSRNPATFRFEIAGDLHDVLLDTALDVGDGA
jgi:hypothetical protein